MAIPTWQDLYDLGAAEAAVRRPELTLLEGDVSDMMLAGAAAMGDRLIGFSASAFRDLYLDGARGDALTKLCSDRWGIVRNAGAAATVTLTLSRTTLLGGAGTISAGTEVGTRFDTQGGSVTFTLDTSVVFGAGDFLHTVNATAENIGIAGNVLAGQITRFITPPFDTSIKVQNVLEAAGGADEETDEALRERTRRFPTTLRRGTIAALEYGAKTVAGVATATAVEGPTGIVTVYIADASGGSNPTLVANVQTELENWRAAGALVEAAGGTLYDDGSGPGHVQIVIQLTVRTGVDVAALVANVRAAIKTRLDQLGIGETLYRDYIRNAAYNVDRAAITVVNVITPAADIQPGADELIRTTTSDIAVS